MLDWPDDRSSDHSIASVLVVRGEIVNPMTVSTDMILVVEAFSTPYACSRMLLSNWA